MTNLQKILCATLTTTGVTLASSGAFAQGAPLSAVLNGGNECTNSPPPPVCRKGDPDGYGSATVIFPTSTSVCFGITVTKIDTPIAAHIHAGTSAINGPIVVNLSPPAAGNPGTSSGCVNDIPIADINKIRVDPTKYYVNVHTGAFPAGAVRGQLQ